MILITGAKGFIGSKLVSYLPSKNIKIFEGDITNQKDVSKAVKGAEKIVHLAAVINPNNKNIFKTNVLGTKILIDEAKKNKVKKFIYISTENVLSKKLDSYSSSKLEAEKIVRTFENYVILRSTAVYGPGDKKYTEKIINIIKKLPVIPLFGNGKFQPLYVEDLIKCISESLDNPRIKGNYLIAGPSSLSFKEFINHIQKILETKKPVIKIPSFLIVPFVSIYQKLSRNPFITFSQLNNLNQDRIYNISEVISAFNYKPTDIIFGLKKSIIS